MAAAIRPVQPTTAAVELVEVVTPRTNAASIAAMTRLLDAAASTAPCSLEIAATDQGCSFLLRAGPAGMRRLLQQFAAAYPQAELRPLHSVQRVGADPARLGNDEVLGACALTLQAPAYLPIRTFRDSDLAPDRAAQADPVLGILGALGSLPAGWRALSQLLLQPAPAHWSDGYQRLALEHPLASERTAGTGGGPSGTSIALLATAVTGLATFALGQQWYAAGDWLQLGLLGSGLLGGVPGAVLLRRRLGRRPLYDPLLVREKLSHRASLAQLRLAVFAPLGTPATDVAARLEQLAAAYQQYSVPAGNGLAPQAVQLQGHELATLEVLRCRHAIGLLDHLPQPAATSLLTSQELAGLWHLPHGQADVPLLERTAARTFLPSPWKVADGCRIGVATQQGKRVPVALPEELLRRHLLLVAKTRRGKSSLLLRLAQEVMTSTGGAQRPALLLIDPHRDLAQAALGLVPAERQDEVVYLDAGDLEQPFGLNLLDTGLGWDQDMAVASALTVFEHEFNHYWGPRMEDIFRFALLTLYAANATLCATEPGGRSRQYTVLQIPALLADPAFRRHVLDRVPGAVVRDWWATYFERLLDRRLQLEAINPVLSKINRYAATDATRLVVGQACSTLDPAAWLRDGRIVIVNTAKGAVGESTAAIIGATLLNLVGLHVAAQARMPPDRRRRICVMVDEFHTMPGADYESYLAELSKVGANLILATQTLARLDALDEGQARALRATLFANLDGLFAFHCSADDAKYLVPELGDELEVTDLVALGEYRCYARLTVNRERLPVCSIQLDPPPATDAALAARLTQQSAQRYGRPRAAVEADLTAAVAQIGAINRVAVERAVGAARPGDSPAAAVARSGRSNNRAKRQQADGSHQPTLIDVLADDHPDDVAGGFREADAEGAADETEA